MLTAHSPLLLNSLELENFRSWQHMRVSSFVEKTIFLGHNGVGKTNIAESLYLLSQLHSFRSSDLTSLIRLGEKSARITLEIMIRQRKYQLSLVIEAQGTLIAYINGERVKPLKNISKYFPVVLFAPEDLRFIKGEPQNRRKYIDNFFSTPRLEAMLSEYQKIIKQKNALLKNPAIRFDKSLLETLNIWDEKLIATAQEIIRARLTIIDEINPVITAAYQELAPHSAKAHFCYEKYVDCDTLEQINQKLMEEREYYHPLEIQRGICLFGPQRDDILLKIGQHNSRNASSHGESWSLALTLRICEYRKIREDDKIPLVILDDVFAELDSHRREKLISLVQDFPQIIITAAVLEDVPPTLQNMVIQVSADTSTEPISSYMETSFV